MRKSSESKERDLNKGGQDKLDFLTKRKAAVAKKCAASPTPLSSFGKKLETASRNSSTNFSTKRKASR